ncbi:PhzF family phenazine biosynthesis protein [Cohnella faecalis]|uniref:PhzF family phenazine biosynthesis protein n=1 Tax=Cohnella faecalis TaxID=2315694 RepID=A0A398CWX6_9BACL|nr:PhzF family phenazine biosynthesis protein [Cohnella faecalis]RIE03514.1 PhzF family phenazine biosynthesis protein [Cohnella faecalis]
MNETIVHHYDAFSMYPNQGNPAGVVLDADHLSEQDMQRIAFDIGFNETVFVVRSEQATVKLKYFTPGHEIPLCGHATMAAVYALKTRGKLGDAQRLTIETNVGVLPIELTETEGVHRSWTIKMKQDNPRFLPFQGDREKLANAIGLDVRELDSSLPIVYGSTGTWTLLVPIKSLQSFREMKPQNEKFPELLTELPKASVHPFCLETYSTDARMHARHFSSPFSGTIEDPVTGTASGVMGAYYLEYMNPELPSAAFVVEQGQEIGKEGRVGVEAIRSEHDGMCIYIAGTAVYVKDLQA